MNNKIINELLKMTFRFNDGGRKKAGYKGYAGDCVCRSICIASGRPYKEVYAILAHGNATQRKTKHTHNHAAAGIRTAARGINVERGWFKKYMVSIGFIWVPSTQKNKPYLKDTTLPKGKIVISMAKHFTASIDGVIKDVLSPSKLKNMRIYGHWFFVG